MEPLSAVAAVTIPAAILYAGWRKAPLSLTLAVAMLASFVLGVVAGRLDPFLGALRFELDLGVWRFGGGHSGPLSYVTVLFLHANLFHLLFNVAFLILLGPILEERIGPLRWAVLFFAGGLVATLVFEAVHLGDRYLLLGASGALSAVFGAFGRLYPRERISLWIPIPLPPMPAIYYVIGFVVVQLLFSVISLGAGPFGGIAWEAHIGGLAFGFAAAPLVMRIPGRRKAERIRDFSVLRPLVAGRELDEIYGHVSGETLPEAQDAWLEKFARKAACPRCGKPLRWARGAMRSECGWKLRIR